MCFNLSKNRPELYYRIVFHAVLQVLWLRPILFVVKAVLDEKTEYFRVAFAFMVFALLSMSFGMTFLLSLYLLLRERIHHLADPTKKFVFIKLLIMIIIVENFAINNVTEMAIKKFNLNL